MLHRNAFAALLLAASAMSLLVSCGEGGQTTPGPTPTRSPLPSPTPVGLETPAGNSIYLGVYDPNILALEKTEGRKYAIDAHYYGWTGLFPGYFENADLASGRIAVDSWNCSVPNAQIASGSQDALIITRALAFKAFGHPVFLRYMWDMNLPSTDLSRSSCYDPTTDEPNNAFSGVEFISAWDRIQAIFAQENVTNVIWVWNVNSMGTDPSVYYPGSAAVGWIGLDAYDPNSLGFTATFQSPYANLSTYGKPILIGETGEPTAGQTAFFQGAASTLQEQFPMIKGFIYYDGDTATNSWQFSLAGQAAFAAFGSSPYLEAYGTL